MIDSSKRKFIIQCRHSQTYCVQFEVECDIYIKDIRIIIIKLCMYVSSRSTTVCRWYFHWRITGVINCAKTKIQSVQYNTKRQAPRQTLQCSLNLFIGVCIQIVTEWFHPKIHVLVNYFCLKYIDNSKS